MEAVTLSTPRKTLLIIDDEPLMTELFRQYMTRRGYRVLTASSGAEALILLAAEAEPVALVITDRTMPQMDGIEVARALEAAYPALPVLMATGYDVDIDPDAIPSNIVGVVQKPFQNSALAKLIQEILDATGSG